MPKESSPWNTVKNNKILVFILLIADIPCWLISGQIASSFIFNQNQWSNWDIIPVISIAVVDFMLHFIFYIFFRFIMKKRIHASIIIVQLVFSAIMVPFMIYELFHSSIILGNMAIFIGSSFWFQVIMFGIFACISSLLDRHTALKSWFNIWASFVLAIFVGVAVSYAVWTGWRELYIRLH
jgi:hypothetical protein